MCATRASSLTLISFHHFFVSHRLLTAINGVVKAKVVVDAASQCARDAWETTDDKVSSYLLLVVANDLC